MPATLPFFRVTALPAFADAKLRLGAGRLPSMTETQTSGLIAPSLIESPKISSIIATRHFMAMAWV